MNLQSHLQFIGVLLVLLSLIHVIFPRYFKWDEELRALSLINRQMIYVHTFFIGFVVLLMGLLCLTSSSELTENAVGRKISAGLAMFWSLRLIIQIFGYSPALWRGKRFETWVHVVFTLIWIYLSIIFWMAARG